MSEQLSSSPPDSIKNDSTLAKDYIAEVPPAPGWSRSMILLELMGLPSSFGVHEYPALLRPNELAIVASVGAFYFWERKQYNKSLKENWFADKEVGYEAMRLNYSGKEPLQKGNINLEKGNNLLLIKPPKVNNPEDPLAQDLTRLAFSEVKKQAAKWNYQAVCLVLPKNSRLSDHFKEQFEASPQVLSSELLAGKAVPIRDSYPAEASLILLTKSEFAALSEDIPALFKKACDSLQEPHLLEAFELLQTAANAEEQQFAEKNFKKQLNNILLGELQKTLDGPEVRLNRDPQTHLPRRERVYSLMQITQQASTLKAQMLNNLGEVQNISLDRLLASDPEEFDLLLASTSPYKKAQIAYVLYELLNQHDIDKVTNQHTLTREAVLEQIDDQFPERFDKQDIKWMLLDPVKVVKKDLKKIQRSFAPILITLLATSALQAAPIHFDIEHPSLPSITLPDIGLPVNIVSGQGSTHSEMNNHKVEFPGTVPHHSLDWKIESHGLSEQGYYTQYTSHDISPDGTWIIDKARQNEVVYTPTIPGNIPQLILEKRITLRSFTSTEVKIPIKDHSKLSAVEVLDKTGHPVSFKAYELTDGTVEVSLPQSILGDYVDIQATLTEDSEGQVAAPQKLKPIDSTQLESSLMNTVENAAMYPDATTKEQYMASAVSISHEYSLNPPGKEALKNAHTPEQLVNTIAELQGCSCEVCNTESVLLSSLISDPDTKVNLAFGYNHAYSQNPASAPEEGYLLGETSHAYGIDGQGTIVDGTATTIAHDQLTWEYQLLLNGSGDADPQSYGDEWQAQLTSTEQQVDTIKNLKIATGLLLLFAALKGGRAQEERIRQLATQENAREIADSMLLSTFSRDELEQAFDLFNYYSYARPGTTFTPRNHSFINSYYRDKRALLNGMRGNIQREALENFLQPPHTQEQLITSPIERLKFRVLARYLL